MLHTTTKRENVCITVPKSPVFEMIKSNKEFEDYGFVDVYGIKAYWAENPYDYYQVADISVHKDVVTQLIEHLTAFQASPIHLRDIVEDYIT